jgi:hypothetical protein
MNLRSRIIRLAHENPTLRVHLLPILKEAALSADDIEDTLEDLLDLNRAVTDSVTEFNAFFRAAALKTGTRGLLDLKEAYWKIREGVKKARVMVESAREFVVMNPEDEDTRELLAKSEKVLATLTVTMNQAKESFELSMSGEMPKRLRVALNQLQATLRQKVNPSLISIEYNHTDHGYGEDDYEGTVTVRVPQDPKVSEGRKYVPEYKDVSITVRLQLKKFLYEVRGTPVYGSGSTETSFNVNQAMVSFWKRYESSRWM